MLVVRVEVVLGGVAAFLLVTAGQVALFARRFQVTVAHLSHSQIN